VILISTGWPSHSRRARRYSTGPNCDALAHTDKSRADKRGAESVEVVSAGEDDPLLLFPPRRHVDHAARRFLTHDSEFAGRGKESEGKWPLDYERNARRIHPGPPRPRDARLHRWHPSFEIAHSIIVFLSGERKRERQREEYIVENLDHARYC